MHQNTSSDIAKNLNLDQPSTGRSRFKKMLMALVLFSGLTATVFLIWRASGTSQSVRYKTQEALTGTLTVTVTATGTLQSTNKVDVGSELSGIIRSVEADYNDRVKAGQVLAKLDTTKLEAQATQNQAALESAKAKVLQTRATVRESAAKLAQIKRVWELSHKKVPSQSELDAAVAAFDRAEADEAGARAAVSQAEATLKATEADIYKSVIRSPINGIVLTRNVEPGQTVAASFTTPVLFTLADDLRKIDLHINVDEADIGKIKERQHASFTVAAYPNRLFAARITQTRYGSSTTSGVVTYETVLGVDNSDLMLRPGMTATAVITVKTVEKVILIPSAALRFTPPVKEEKKQSGSFINNLLPRPPQRKSQQGEEGSEKKSQQQIYVLRNNQIAPVAITIGSSSQGLTEVVSGNIQAGTAVVVDALSGEK
jgi:HlyD family secretion protein